ncbi:glycosyltransferase [Fulvivirgaceae bacterium BMA10]|uniref:Glycosyltransferase n=1 Tax=Splendidivirga corallicola TaxID=3051826 RepID=A0ABT8KQZ2_9BACT|nr:glycosyltransferase [Fulvivirgaceae bacterium BMA10]
MIKVVMVIDTLTGGGKERRLVELLKGLSTSNETITYALIILSDIVSYKEVYELPGEVHTIQRNSSRDLSVFKKLYKICRVFDPDIIQAWESMAAMYSMPVSKFLGAKFINSSISHAPEYIKPFSKMWMRARFTFPFSSAIIANSKAGLDSYKAPYYKSYCFYNGFDYNRISELKDVQEVRNTLKITTKYVVGMVAEFSGKKDYATYIKAAQLILKNRNDVSFICVGKGATLEKMKALVKDENQERIIFVNWTDDVESVINSFDIGVLATYTEGVSNAIMEYMVMGLPVVATDGGGTKEILLDQKTGYLVERSNISDLADKIESLLSNEQLAHEMGKAGKERIRQEFNLEKMTESYIELYKKLSS